MCIAKKIDLFSISYRILPQVLHCAPGQAWPGRVDAIVAIDPSQKFALKV